LLFRKNPFGGEYTVFAGLDECIRYAANFHFTPADLEYLKTALPPTTEVRSSATLMPTTSPLGL
jgi:nicotinate phosphoribosyltransferase